ncbi:uncharacterized protein LOC130717044 isoform X3 [Lotus japonicus]|uniref:uncharacterized protein LOC130717044 isoform X3 n=1 Tax=Lotus japonicus TaxID=34305 RepID=UPI00258317ED|nr:uncharacterized protein LOC130717044 isoform X3 [Lotus japonicus]
MIKVVVCCLLTQFLAKSVFGATITTKTDNSAERNVHHAANPFSFFTESPNMVSKNNISSLHHLLLALGFLLSATLPFALGESSTCLTVYKTGGAPAVFQSPKCPRWKLSDYNDSPPQTTARCQSAVLQGRRKSQEDRALCLLDIRIPFPGAVGIKEVAVGIVAVFDGHNGEEASEMASKLLVEYFVLHTYFLLDAAYSVISKTSSTETMLHTRDRDHVKLLHRWKEILGLQGHELHSERFQYTLTSKFDDSFHLEILKEALLRAIHDIDAKFSEPQEIIFLQDLQQPLYWLQMIKFWLPILETPRPSCALKIFSLLERLKELTSDHHPDRDDERMRVEKAGGQVIYWAGLPRVNGQLAITRAIGDVFFKSYGVISAPEVTDWQPLTANDSYLVVASDGVFEKMSVQDVCDLLWEVHRFSNMRSECAPSSSYSLADFIVNTAFKKGSMDNMAAVVIPLESAKSSTNSHRSYTEKKDTGFPLFGLQEPSSRNSAHGMSSELIHLEHPHLVDTKFKRILVEGNHGDFGCFYLSENLDELVDSKGPAKKTDREDHLYELPPPPPDALHAALDGPVNLYNKQNFCFHLGPTVSEAKDQCINPEGFASFIGILGSIPLNDTGSNNGSSDYSMPDLRYVLKKSYGRGSYGEVWLAFHWNCNQGNDGAKMSKDDNNINSSSTTTDWQDGPSNYTLYILKRIMVERGSAVYLSGLREKYFGETFLNASTCFEDLLSAGKSNCVLETSQFGSDDSFPNKFRPQRSAYEEGLNHIARYVESFESRSNEIWLVFNYEGVSLSKLIYTVEDASDSSEKERPEQVKHVQILRPSKWWHWMKTTEEGQEEMRNLIWQLLLALKSCHDRNITHRDIKPENMVICFEDQETGRCLKEIPTTVNNFSTKMRIIDFGSGIDEFTLKHLYGSTGPSRDEQTYDYTAPEALLNATWFQGSTSSTMKYDMWSVGVVMLELVLGTPNVFQINALTRALLDRHLEGWNEDVKKLAYKLRSFMELCILVPGISGSASKKYHTTNQVGVSPASWKCSEEFFSRQIKNRDPLKIGFSNVWALRLVRHLLLWDPEDRLSVDEALQHPYFQPPPRGL